MVNYEIVTNPPPLPPPTWSRRNGYTASLRTLECGQAIKITLPGGAGRNYGGSAIKTVQDQYPGRRFATRKIGDFRWIYRIA